MTTAIPEEEWSLLATAVTEPVRQLIAVEAVDREQRVEVVRRLTGLAVGRPLLRLPVRLGEEGAEAVLRRAHALLADASEAGPLPLLLVELDAPPPADAAAAKPLAELWRGMNQLREGWHDLPAQILFLLSPAAYHHLTLNADHLKRWIGLKVRLWERSTDLEVLERPGRAEREVAVPEPVTEEALERRRLALLAKQFGTAGDVGGVESVRRYLLPLINGYIALGDLEEARAWRRRIPAGRPLGRAETEALSKLDERLNGEGKPAPTFDLFLSHNGRDKPAVRELAAALRERGLLVWLDEDELRPGLNWQTALETAVRLSGSVAVAIGRDGLGPWEQEEMQAALMLAVRDGRPVIPVLLPGSPSQPELPLFLASRTWVDLRAGLDEAGLARLEWGITGRRAGADSGTCRSAFRPTRDGARVPPRVGLKADLQGDAALRRPSPFNSGPNPFDPWTPAIPPRFFGREKLLRQLGTALDHGRSVSVVGDRRIGKTSLLQRWAELARQRGRVVKLLSGEGPEAISCAALVGAIVGRPVEGEDPDRAADRLAEWVAEAGELPPLVLVDEAERALIHLPHRFFERLRGMLGRLCLVLASRREIGEIGRDDHLTSPLENRLELLRVGLLEEAAVAGLIGLGEGVLTAADVDLMRQWAGRHPCYLALLGHYLWEARCHGEEVDEALEEFRDNAFPRLAELWEMLTEGERERLVAAARGGLTEPANGLKRRGLLDDGRPFGEVVTAWLEERGALEALQAAELQTLANDRRYQALVELQGRWLPGRDTDSPLLKSLAEAARFLAAADGTTSPHLARQHLEAAERQLTAVDNLLQGSREPLARFLPPTLAAWRELLHRLRAEAEAAAAHLLPNPFVAGNPISGEMAWGRQVFRGREGTVRQVEGLLADERSTASLALIGPRRSGKSSLLNMFRVLLPDTQVVLFDLQDNPATTPATLYRALAGRAQEQAHHDRRLALPALPEGPPIEALRDWLDALERLPGVARFLICIDEFERLPSLFPGSGPELMQFMGLMRATIQHRRRVRLLVAGAAPFDELDRLWSDHFINLREIRLGFLDGETTVGLLTRPVEEFPPTAIPTAVAQEVATRSGGQPYLAQFYGSLLVDRLNEAKRKAATAEDLAPVEEELLGQGANYFRNLWGDLSPAAQEVVAGVAAGGVAPPDGATLRRLRRRLILDEAGRLVVPLFGRWVREEAL